MIFDALNIADCIIPPVGGDGGGGPVVDQRCLDSDFASANPTICGSSAYLIVKPANALLCKLGTINFSVFLYQNGVETEVTDSLTFTSSDEDILAIGVHTGSATGLAEGEVNVTVTRNGLTTQSAVTVLITDCGIGCCDEIHIKTSILIDDSKSMSLAFGGGYQSRLDFAKEAALDYAGKILNTCDVAGAGVPKDSIKVWSFTDLVTQVSTDFLTDTVELASEINGVTQTQQKTDLGAILLAAVNDIVSATADEKVILLISDGEQTVGTNLQPILDTAATFKALGGIIIVVGLRASGTGYDLLSRIATGGFFLNATASNAADVLAGLNYLKSILCAGECPPTSGTVNTPELNYSSFLNWEVISGQVNLIGSGFLDLQPGNGLYVDMMGGTAGTIRSIDTFSLVAGRDYRITFEAAGNNRLNTPAANQTLLVSIKNASPIVPVNLATIFSHVVAPAWDSAFASFAFTFTAAFDVDVKLLFQQLYDATFTGEWHGDLLDCVKFEEVSTLTTLLNDCFDGENPVYVTDNCSSDQSSQSSSDLIPPMTGFSTPSGIVSASSTAPAGTYAWKAFCGIVNFSPTDPNRGVNWWESAVYPTNTPQWLQYQFATQQIVTSYRMSITNYDSGNPLSCSMGPKSWTFEGSENGTDWTVLDTQTDYVSVDVLCQSPPIVFNISNTQAFLYYRIHITKPQGAGDVAISEFQMSHQITNNASGYNGYNCEPCSDTSQTTQVPDPNPLPDVESGLPVTTNYTSTKTACAGCQAGYINLGSNLIPQMTSNTTPSGIAYSPQDLFGENGIYNQPAWKAFNGIADGTAQNGWAVGFTCAGDGGYPAIPLILQYQFPAPQIVSCYSITGLKPTNNPKTFTFEGSLDGSTWTVLDAESGLIWFVGEEKTFQISSPGNYQYYRLSVTQIDSPALINDPACELYVQELKMFPVLQSQICQSATATSAISQADADSRATAAALALAQSGLNCVPQFTSTQQYTASCPISSLGSDVTKSVTATSLISQADADNNATIAAKAAAVAALVCNTSNNGQKITINDNAPASPYPSVKYVSGLTGLITKVTVAINGLYHEYDQDVQIFLRSPAGTLVRLMGNCGSGSYIGSKNFGGVWTGINLVFDDAAASSLLNSTPVIAGTFKPTGFTPLFVPPTPFPAGSIYTTLAEFIGETPNGSWSLWVNDNKPFDVGAIANGWDLTISV